MTHQGAALGVTYAIVLFAVGPVRPAGTGHVCARQVCGDHGRPAVGHPHGTAVRHAVRRRDAKA